MTHAQPDTLPKVVFDPVAPDVAVPERATRGAAGYDVRAHLAGRVVRVRDAASEHERAIGADGRLTLQPGDVALVPLGFRARLPAGYEAQVRLRSSIAFRRGLMMPNAPGTIDADYPDEWMVMLKNIGARAVGVAHGERIAQVIIARYGVVEWVAGRVGVTTDRVGGVGSTG